MSLLSSACLSSASPVSFEPTEISKKKSPCLHEFFRISAHSDPILQGFGQKYKFKKTDLGSMLETLAGQKHLEDSWQKNRQILVQAFSANDHLKVRHLLRTIVKNLPLDQVNDLFEHLIASSFQAMQADLPFKRCLELFTLDELEKIYGEEKPNFITAAQIAQELSEQIKGSALQILQQNFKVSAKRSSLALFRFISRLLDTATVAFSFFLNKEPGSSWDASQTLSFYGKLLMFPLTIFLGLKAFFSWTVAVIATITVLSLLALLTYIYVKFGRRVPENLPWGMNATRKAEQGKLSRVVGRESEIQQLLDNLLSKHHTLLLGPSGVGKTEIVKGLAQRFALGDVPHQLKGLQVYMIKASRLVNDGISFDSSDNLQKLLSRVGPKAIIFIDEIHVLMNDKYKAIMEQLKTYLEDNNPDGIRYFIGATNQTKSIDDEAFLNRFISMPISISRAQTLNVLHEVVFSKALDISIGEDVLESIVSLTMKGSQFQPRVAKRLLNQAITIIHQSQNSIYQPVELQQKQAQYQELCSRLLLLGRNLPGISSKQSQELILQRNTLKLEIEGMQIKIQEAGRKIKKIQALKVHLKIQREHFYSLAERIALGHDRQKLSKQLLFFNYSLLPYLEGEMRKLVSEVDGVPVQIDKALLKGIIQNWEGEEKAQAEV